MTGGGNDLLGNQNLTADSALLALGQADFGTGGSLTCKNLLGVAGGGNDLLGNQNLATDRTLLTLSQAGFGAGGSLAGDDLLGVTQRGNDLLGNDSLAADGALLALGQAGFGTGGSLSCKNLLGMSGRGNDLLGYQNLTADGALLALGQAGFGTGRSLAGDDLLGVAGGGNDLLGNQNLTADGALRAFGQAGFGTGCSLTGDNFLSVGQLGAGNGFAAQLFTADGAVNHGLIGTGHGAGGIDRILDHGCSGCVTQGGNGDRLTAELCAADIAIDRDVVGTAIGAVGSDLMLLFRLAGGMPQSGGLVGHIAVAADGAGVGGIAAGGAGGRSHDGLIFVTQSGDLLLHSQNLTADGALPALGQAGFGTGRSLAGDDLLGMPQRCNFIRHIADATDGAHMGGIAALGAGGRCGDAVAGDMLGVQNTVHIEHILSVFKVPAVLQGIDQGIAVAEGGIVRAEGGAPVAGIAGIDVGGQAVGLLVGGIAGEGVQRTGGQVELIAQGGAVGGGQAVVLVPGGLCLGGQSDAADHADGVGGGRLDGCGLLDPVQADAQHIGLRVQLRAGQGEIFVLQAQSGQIHIKIGIDLDFGSDLGQHTDPVGKL